MASYNPIPWLMTRQTINFLDTIEKWKERREKGNITINSFLQDSRQSIKYSNVNWLKKNLSWSLNVRWMWSIGKLGRVISYTSESYTRAKARVLGLVHALWFLFAHNRWWRLLKHGWPPLRNAQFAPVLFVLFARNSSPNWFSPILHSLSTAPFSKNLSSRGLPRSNVSLTIVKTKDLTKWTIDSHSRRPST